MTDRKPDLFHRFFAHPLTLLFVGILIFAAFVLVAQIFTNQLPPSGPNDPMRVAKAAIVALAAIAGYWVFVRKVERAPFSDFTGSGALIELGTGVALGALLFACVVAVIAAFGQYRITGSNPPDVIIPVLGLSIVSAVTEEIFIRGLFFRLLERWLGSWIALALSAALFGLGHLANPNASLLAGLAIAIEAGILLAATYMVTRRLWAAIGLHFAWNFTEGGIFGVSISGNETSGLLKSQLSGPPLVSGGAFGAEASLPAVAIATAAGIVALVIAYRRGSFVAPSWRRNVPAQTKL